MPLLSAFQLESSLAVYMVALSASVVKHIYARLYLGRSAVGITITDTLLGMQTAISISRQSNPA